MRPLDGSGLAALLLAAAVLAGCTRGGTHAAESSEVKELRYLGGFGGVTYPELAEDLGFLAPLRLRWKGNVLGGPAAIQAVTTGDVDFGSAATGSIVKLQAAGAPIVQVITSQGVDRLTWGGAYVLEGSAIRTPRDLIGRKISVNTLGAHSEFMIREWLGRAGLTREEIRQVTLVVVPPASAELTLRNRDVDAATLGGIIRDRAVGRGGLRLLYSDRDLFGDFNASTYVFRKDFVRDHADAVRRFVEGTARAVEWARATPRDEVRARLARIYATRGRGEDPEYAEHWNSAGVASQGGVISDRDVQLWIDWLAKEGDISPERVGTVSALYTNEFNPYRR